MPCFLTFWAVQNIFSHILGTEADIVGLLNNHSPPKLDDGYNEERIDEGCLDEGGDDNDDSENDNDSESTASLGQPAISLERLVLAYDAMREKQRIEELNPDIENQSAETRKRPSDYDSLGEDYRFTIKPFLFLSSQIDLLLDRVGII